MFSAAHSFQSGPTDGMVVTDGWLRIGAAGDPDAARVAPDGVRDGSWCRARNVPHLGCRPTPAPEAIV